MRIERVVHEMTSPITAAFLNKSSLVKDFDCVKWAIACAFQARVHAAPLWKWPEPSLVFLPDESFVRPEHDLIYLFDDADTAGALGYHDLTPSGQPYAKIFARDCLDNNTAISSCLSHEVLELLGDPTCDAWALAPDGFEYALELCDAVQDSTYEIDGVAVSNFVLPDFFNQGGAPYDYRGELSKPFQTGRGGYQIRRDPKTGKVSQVFGDRPLPEWLVKSKAHPAARSARRMLP